MKNVKYSKGLEETASMVVIDGELTKSRFGHTMEDVAMDINNCNDVLVQRNDKIDIYCRQENMNDFKEQFKNLKEDILYKITVHCNGCSASAYALTL